METSYFDLIVTIGLTGEQELLCDNLCKIAIIGRWFSAENAQKPFAGRAPHPDLLGELTVLPLIPKLD